ncbi:MAG TPA: GNAT family N-acetyltransferase [Gemmatimonadales bacterium]|nr:GNAT family N-acetyltransferase [Gemmatimonadales bacterium]
MSFEIRILGPADTAVLTRVAEDVFDHPVDPALAETFLADPRHHLAVAIDRGVVVGFASGVHYIHPDKAAELWINEVAVAPTHHGQGIGKAVVHALLVAGRQAGCREAWVLTDDQNKAALNLYRAAGGKRTPVPQVMFSFDLDEVARPGSLKRITRP